MAGAVDYWCNLFTPEAVERNFLQASEVAEVVRWWGMEKRIVGRSVTEFVSHMDGAGVDAVLIPAARMASYRTGELIWNVKEEDVVAVAEEAAGRIYGLVGIDPRDIASGVRHFKNWISEGHFVGAHLHTYGFGLPIDHARYYPYYAACVEADVPLVVQVGHSAERMPSAAGRPILLDQIALDFPDLVIVAAHTGWPWVTELIALAWKHPNIYIGTSAHHPRYWGSELVSFANTRGVGKVVFGTDYPVIDFEAALSAIDDLEMRPDARDQLVSGVARKLFKIH